jgi:hypothetical protein
MKNNGKQKRRLFGGQPGASARPKTIASWGDESHDSPPLYHETCQTVNQVALAARHKARRARRAGRSKLANRHLALYDALLRRQQRGGWR